MLSLSDIAVVDCLFVWNNVSKSNFALAEFKDCTLVAICVMTETACLSLSPQVSKNWLELASTMLEGKTKVTWNGKAFDDGMLSYNGLPMKTDLDILEAMQCAYAQRLGSNGVFKLKGYRLPDIALHNTVYKCPSFGQIPKHWENRNFKKLVNICHGATRVTHELLTLGLEGRLYDPMTGVTLDFNDGVIEHALKLP